MGARHPRPRPQAGQARAQLRAVQPRQLLAQAGAGLLLGEAEAGRGGGAAVGVAVGEVEGAAQPEAPHLPPQRAVKRLLLPHVGPEAHQALGDTWRGDMIRFLILIV